MQLVLSGKLGDLNFDDDAPAAAQSFRDKVVDAQFNFLKIVVSSLESDEELMKLWKTEKALSQKMYTYNAKVIAFYYAKLFQLKHGEEDGKGKAKKSKSGNKQGEPGAKAAPTTPTELFAACVGLVNDGRAVPKLVDHRSGLNLLLFAHRLSTVDGGVKQPFLGTAFSSRQSAVTLDPSALANLEAIYVNLNKHVAAGRSATATETEKANAQAALFWISDLDQSVSRTSVARKREISSSKLVNDKAKTNSTNLMRRNDAFRLWFPSLPAVLARINEKRSFDNQFAVNTVTIKGDSFYLTGHVLWRAKKFETPKNSMLICSSLSKSPLLTLHFFLFSPFSFSLPVTSRHIFGLFRILVSKD